MSKLLCCFGICLSALLLTGLLNSCANIVPPGGGPIDSLPPRLVSAKPGDSATNVGTQRITLTFDEYVNIENPQENVIVNPLPEISPGVERKLKTVTVTLRDTLRPNTTYSINFGNAIKDLNEGNVLKNFTYVFSTGATVDTASISGNVYLAETGEVDSTLVVVLHKNLNDTAVQKDRPGYMTRIDGAGRFRFNNLAPGQYAVYALPNEFSKRYDDSTKLFAFLDSAVTANNNPAAITLYAFRAFEKGQGSSKQNTSPTATSKAPVGIPEQPLQYNTNASGMLTLLDTLTLTFNRNVTIDTTRLRVTDTTFRIIAKPTFIIDSNSVRIWFPLQESFNYLLLIDSLVAKDSAGRNLRGNDTISFITNRESEYGSLRLRFANFDRRNNPVLLLVQNDQVIERIPLNTNSWYRRLFKPGQYELKLHYDRNNNGRWDTGSFLKTKRQPEVVRDLKRTITVRGNWDNETDITF